MLIEDNGLIDVRRLVNPKKREYTFYSHSHKSRSRIDLVLISQSLTYSVIDSNINAIPLSDHAVELCANIHSDKLRQDRWSMNMSLLQDEIFTKGLAEDLS